MQYIVAPYDSLVSCLMPMKWAGIQPDSIVVTLVLGGESDQVYYYQDGRITERCDAGHEFEFIKGVLPKLVTH